MLFRSKNVCTSLYKLSRNSAQLWLSYLKKSKDRFYNCEGYELIFGDFIDTIKENVSFIDKIGVSGFIAVDGNYMEW